MMRQVGLSVLVLLALAVCTTQAIHVRRHSSVHVQRELNPRGFFPKRALAASPGTVTLKSGQFQVSLTVSSNDTYEELSYVVTSQGEQPATKFTAPTLNADPEFQPFSNWTVSQTSSSAAIVTASIQWSSSVTLQYKRSIGIIDVGVSVSEVYTGPANFNYTSFESWYDVVCNQTEAATMWSQSIKYEPQAYVAHWQFKNPVVLAHHKPAQVLAAIVATTSHLTNASLIESPLFLDLANARDNTTGLWNTSMSFGVGQNTQKYHSVYMRASSTLEFKGQVTLDYTLYLEANISEYNAYSEIASYLWQRDAWPVVQATPQQQQNYKNLSLTTFDTWRDHCWLDVKPTVYIEWTCGDVNPVGSGEPLCSSLKCMRNVWADHVGTDNDMWLNAWFQTVRTAYGMYMYATEKNDTTLQEQAFGIVRLTLSAPQPKGIFPSIYWHGNDTSPSVDNWINDSGWAGFEPFFHSFDTAWTGYWLLRWASDLRPDARDAIVKFTRGLGDFFVSAQLMTGVFPSWYNATTLEPKADMGTVNAETGGVALFLAELYAATGDDKYLTSSKQGLDFITKEIIPTRRWWDFETFKSCSPKPFDFFDTWTNQYPENNLGKIQSALAYLRVYELTHDVTYLANGMSVVNYTSLTQATFSHPSLTPHLTGGFTTQNTDAEWSDARQGYASVMYLRYYRASRVEEYLQRGVAALRAGFAIAPYENWAHTGGIFGDLPGAISGFHWGTGSQTTSQEIIAQWFGDAYIDAVLGHTIGINGLTASALSCDQTAATCSVTMKGTFKFTSPLKLAFVARGTAQSWTVTVNGQQLPAFQSSGTNDPVFADLPASVLNA